MKKEENDIQYDIVKSEACGHSIEYKRLAKQFGAPGMPPMGGGAPMAAPAGGPAGAAPMMMNEDKEEECKCKSEDKEDCECEKESPKDDLEKNTDQEVRETKGIDYDKEHDSDKTKEEKKKKKRPLEKCGDMIAAKKSERFYIKEIQKLRKRFETQGGGDPNIYKPTQREMAVKDLSSPSIAERLNPSSGIKDVRESQLQTLKNSSDPEKSVAPNSEQFGAGIKSRIGEQAKAAPQQKMGDKTQATITNTGTQAPNQGKSGATTSESEKNAAKRMYTGNPEGDILDEYVQRKGLAPTTKPQEQTTATADAAPKYGMKNPFASKGELDKMSFGDAFKEARKTGAGNVFNWKGQKYNTYTRPEMEAMAKKPEENTRQTTAPKETAAATAPTAKETPYEREQRQFENRKFTPEETRQLSAAFPQSEFAMRNRGPGGKLNEARGIDNTTPSFEKLRQFQRNRVTGSGDTGGYSMKQLNQIMRRLRQRRQ